MIYTVFPKCDADPSAMPQDFETMSKAKKYAAELEAQGIASDIEQTDGEME
jgi:hypothetical protein